MLDPDLQQRFTRRCADAALGYSAASTAAYAAMAEQVLNFWSDMLQPPASKPQPPQQLWHWPVPMGPTPPAASTSLFNPFAWMLPPAPAPRHISAGPGLGGALPASIALLNNALRLVQAHQLLIPSARKVLSLLLR